MNCTKPHRNIT